MNNGLPFTMTDAPRPMFEEDRDYHEDSVRSWFAANDDELDRAYRFLRSELNVYDLSLEGWMGILKAAKVADRAQVMGGVKEQLEKATEDFSRKWSNLTWKISEYRTSFQGRGKIGKADVEVSIDEFRFNLRLSFVSTIGGVKKLVKIDSQGLKPGEFDYTKTVLVADRINKKIPMAEMVDSALEVATKAMKGISKLSSQIVKTDGFNNNVMLGKNLINISVSTPR